MTPKTQHPFVRTVPTAIVAAALCVACGRSEVQDPADNEVRTSVINSNLSPEQLSSVPSLSQFRLTQLRQLPSAIPNLDINRVQQAAATPGRPQLTEWSVSEYGVDRLNFLPMIYDEHQANGDVVRYRVHFDDGRIMKMATWEAHDEMWIPIAHLQLQVKLTGLPVPPRMWSDLLGAVEIANCRLNDKEQYDCAAGRDDNVNVYYPRHLGKGEGPTDLACLAGCPDPDAASEDPYFHNVSNPTDESPFDVVVAYSFDPAEQMLYQNGSQIVPSQADAPAIVSGFMFPMEEKYIAMMACDADEKDEVFTGVCAHHALSRFYTWSTDGNVPVLGRSGLR